MKTKLFRSLGVVAAASVLVLSACASDGGATEDVAEDASATASELATITPGKLTIATGEPAYFPWVIDDAPETGEGFEAAVAYAVAGQLGFDNEDVVWVRTTFDSAIAPGPKDFDFNLQQYSITEERKEAVDFSSPYYVSSQAVVTVEGSSIADASSVADLKSANIGVAVGTTSLDVVNEVIAPDSEPSVFNSNEDAVQALQAGQIDSLVIDLPSAFYLAGAVLDGGIIVGQLNSDAGGDELGLLLAKDSPLTQPVTEAVDTLREEGVLDEIAQEWLADYAEAPVLE